MLRIDFLSLPLTVSKLIKDLWDLEAYLYWRARANFECHGVTLSLHVHSWNCSRFQYQILASTTRVLNTGISFLCNFFLINRIVTLVLFAITLIRKEWVHLLHTVPEGANFSYIMKPTRIVIISSLFNERLVGQVVTRGRRPLSFLAPNKYLA